MTMPQLMNCVHSDTGWCLNCVKELHESKNTVETVLKEAVEANKWCQHVCPKPEWYGKAKKALGLK